MLEQYSILLATYNGERYVEKLLESCPWPNGASLIMRDDGSTDKTLEIVRNFTSRHGVPVIILEGERLGTKNSFAKTLEKLEKPYFLFADQDDVWEKNKISILFKTMQSLETQYGKDTPLLVYSDASLMHEDGDIFHNSWLKASTVPYGWNEKIRQVIVMPHVLGCTMLGNRALARAALPIAEDAIMHDSWVLQVACALGHVREISLPLVRYRQHSTNVYGANVVSLSNVFHKILEGRKPKYKTILQSQKQAGALVKHCGHLMSQDVYGLCTAWSEARKKNWLVRRFLYAKYGFKKAGWLHNLVLWICG